MVFVIVVIGCSVCCILFDVPGGLSRRFDVFVTRGILNDRWEALDRDILEKVAKALKVSAEAIKSFSEETAINVISSTFNDNSSIVNNNPIFNPLDKLMEALEENKKLYSALLKEKDEKIALLEKMIEKK